ncbi:Lipoprotein signal peptidase [Frankliniella fusca]|uniref:Lipoprotein signal peptidase n=2 Tax=Frankliniella fusca TaxID=407009 RepID=A0AAE1GS27_9NEOP|nr:Lipoprotein signal peptidase [Frankliniella fusca]
MHRFKADPSLKCASEGWRIICPAIVHVVCGHVPVSFQMNGDEEDVDEDDYFRGGEDCSKEERVVGGQLGLVVANCYSPSSQVDFVDTRNNDEADVIPRVAKLKCASDLPFLRANSGEVEESHSTQQNAKMKRKRCILKSCVRKRNNRCEICGHVPVPFQMNGDNEDVDEDDQCIGGEDSSREERVVGEQLGLVVANSYSLSSQVHFVDLVNHEEADVMPRVAKLKCASDLPSPLTNSCVGKDSPDSHSSQQIVKRKRKQTNFALQLKGWRENMENFCGSKPPEGGCGSRQAQGFYPLWQPTASVFHGNRRFADCDPIAQFDRFDPRTTIGLPLEVRAVSRALDFLIPVSEALPQRGTRDSNPQPRVPTRSQNRKRPNAQSHRANGGETCLTSI